MRLLFLIYSLEHLRDVHVTLVGDDALSVVVQLLFRGRDILFDMRHHIFIDVQLFQNLLVPLENLHGVPALLFLRQAVQRGFLYMGQRVVHRAGKLVLRHGLAALGRFHCGFGGFPDAVALERRYLQHLAAQLAGQFLYVDAVAVLLYQVHHVDRHHHRYAQLGKLGGQVEVALQVGAVHDVEYRVGAVVGQVVPRHHLFQCVRGQRIYAGQVDNGHVRVLFKLAFLLLHRDAGPVAHVLV